MVENTVDSTTGMVTMRATMQNENEMLWPGTLVTTRLDDADRGGGGGADRRRAAQPERQLRLHHRDGKSPTSNPLKSAHFRATSVVIRSGLNGGENVVTDGQLLLSKGTPVDAAQRPRPAGS